MTGTEETRSELIERVHKAARIERAKTVQRLLRRLIRHEPGERAWPTPAQPAVGDCR